MYSLQNKNDLFIINGCKEIYNKNFLKLVKMLQCQPISVIVLLVASNLPKTGIS